MGLRGWIRRTFLRVIRIYDKPYQFVHERRFIAAGSTPKRPLLSQEGLVVKIWVRNLKPAKDWKVPAIARLGHWCIQVGGRYYELLLENKTTVLNVTNAPDHPFEKSEHKPMAKSSRTAFSADEVDAIVQKIYSSEFEGHYFPSAQDCQRLCMRIWTAVCAREDEEEADSQYFNGFSFALAYSTMSPPPNITHPTTTVSPAVRHNIRHSGGHSGRHTKHSSISSQGWFQAALTNQIPR